MATLRTLLLGILVTMMFSYMMIAQVGFYELTTNTLTNATLKSNLEAVVGNLTVNGNSIPAQFPTGGLFANTTKITNSTYANASALKNLNPVTGVFNVVTIVASFLGSVPSIMYAFEVFISVPIVFFIPSLATYAILIGQIMTLILIFMAIVAAILLFPN